jgi:alpha-1,3-glucan synthase
MKSNDLMKRANSHLQGQILAANSYQITLLNGEVGESAEKLYLIATIYLVFSVVWWIVFRSLRSIFVLSVPFLVRMSPIMA